MVLAGWDGCATTSGTGWHPAKTARSADPAARGRHGGMEALISMPIAQGRLGVQPCFRTDLREPPSSAGRVPPMLYAVRWNGHLRPAARSGCRGGERRCAGSRLKRKLRTVDPQQVAFPNAAWECQNQTVLTPVNVRVGPRTRIQLRNMEASTHPTCFGTRYLRVTILRARQGSKQGLPGFSLRSTPLAMLGRQGATCAWLRAASRLACGQRFDLRCAP